MKSLELTKPITTESLLSEFESRFNQTLDVSNYTKEELEDTANHIRTKIHNITQNTHFGQELKNEQYQKSQMMLDIVNQAIKEYGSGEMKSDPKTKALVKKIQAAPGIQDKDKKEIIGDIVTDSEKVQEKEFNPADRDEPGQEHDQAPREGDVVNHKDLGKVSVVKVTGSDQMGQPAEYMVQAKLSYDELMGDVELGKFESAIREGVEEQSELILAAKDMMDKVTGYLEDLASMKTEGMLELADRIRDEMGADKADAFMQKIQPAIEQAEATLTTTRQELDNGVRILTGEEVASEPMGADDTMDMDTDLDSLDSEGGEETDEFGASDAEAGGTEPEGREQRESREVFETSNRLYSKLAGK